MLLVFSFPLLLETCKQEYVRYRKITALGKRVGRLTFMNMSNNDPYTLVEILKNNLH